MSQEDVDVVRTLYGFFAAMVRMSDGPALPEQEERYEPRYPLRPPSMTVGQYDEVPRREGNCIHRRLTVEKGANG